MLISIIIPTYNKGSYLVETVQSVLKQGYSNKEILIVNDGSTDNSLEVAKGIAREHPAVPITVYDKSNSGISDTRNYAISRARGELIATLDGDDQMADGYLEAVSQKFQSEPATDLVSCDVELFGEEKDFWTPPLYEPFNERYNNNIPTLVTYKKSLWEKIGGYDTAFAFNEDWNFFIAGEKFDMKVEKLESPYLRYRVDSSGLARNFIKDTWKHSVSLMMISQSDFYPVVEIFRAHEILREMPERWHERFLKQRDLHPRNWLLEFWLGIYQQGKGNYEAAVECYAVAATLAPERQWQPFFMMGKYFEMTGETKKMKEFFHYVRIRRPDASIAFQGIF